MKKNITINLCGRLFNIDEDAYELLRNYMDTLRSFFSRQEGGEEIADDIESRVGELLEELKSQGVEAINIEHVKQVITRIGRPEEIAQPESTRQEPFNASAPRGQEETSEESCGAHGGNGRKTAFSDFLAQLKETFSGRRFYRNPKDKMLAGVLSGLSSSFETDPTLLRLAVVAAIIFLSLLGSMFGYHRTLSLFNMNVCLAFAVVYLLLAAIMPAAETPEQQLKMQGKPVNMQNLAEEVVQNAREKVGKVNTGGVAKSVLNTILRFFAGCFKFVMVLLAVALFFAGMCALLCALFAIYSPDNMTQFFDWNMEAILHDNLPMFVMFLVAFLVALFIPAYAIVQHLIHPLKAYQRLLLLLVWLAAVATAITTGAMLTQIDARYYSEQHRNDIRRDDLVLTADSVEMKYHEFEFLREHDWHILNGEGCNTRFTAYGEYYVGKRRHNRYLDSYDEHHRQQYRAERTDTLMPGRYRLTCAARANGKGAFVYLSANGKKQLLEIPATGNTGGSIWQEAKAELDTATTTGSQPSDMAMEIAHANEGKGYGWNRMEFDEFTITKPNTAVSYGLTSDPHFTGKSWLGQWFSACDFVIERAE